MLYFLRYIGKQKFTWIGFSVLFFMFTLILRGNNERVGVGFISLNALPAFLIIILGFRWRIDIESAFTKTCIAILIFTLASFIINKDSIIPLYSIGGNILLAMALVQAFNQGISKITIDSIAVILSVVYFTYYVGFWTPFASDEFSIGESRLSYLSMNPNGVSEYIILSVISLIYIFFRLKRVYNIRLGLYVSAIVLVSLIPLVVTASRKGFILYILCLLLFFAIKFRWYQIKRFYFIVATVVVIIISIPVFQDLRINQTATLVNRFDENIFNIESDQRYQLIYRSMAKGLERPILGHGLESSRDPKFLKSIGLWNYDRNSPINSHNGFVNIFLKGGIVYLCLYLLLFYVPIRQLWMQIKALSQDTNERDLLILSLIYLIIFLTHILSSGNGELFKLGWLLLGFAVGQLELVKRQLFFQWKTYEVQQSSK